MGLTEALKLQLRFHKKSLNLFLREIIFSKALKQFFKLKFWFLVYNFKRKSKKIHSMPKEGSTINFDYSFISLSVTNVYK